LKTYLFLNHFLPSDSYSRAGAAALLGQQLFAQYIRDLKDPQLAVNKNQMRNKLEETLQFLRMAESLTKPSSVKFRDAVTGLMLVEATLYEGDADRAVSILDSSLISPLKIIKDQSPAVFGDRRAAKFKSDAYRAIVKTYIAKMQGSDQQQLWIDKANGVIGLMKQEADASGDPKEKDQLTAIYQLIAIELKKRFDGLQDPSKKQKFSAVLAKFLASIEKNSRQGKVVLISGATMLEIATEISESGLPDEAKPMFRQAVSALDRAEKLGFAGEEDSKALGFELKRQRALAERGSGNFKEAVDQFVEILKESNSFSVQLDAAATLQRWGKVARLQKPLLQAVKGTGKYEDPKSKRKVNAIWGWEKILGATRGDKKKFRDQYFLASYSIAEAIYEQAIILKKSASKKSALKFIKRERAKTPDFLGSQKWKDKFLELEKRIGGG
jgi:tetratricopeptide (TPR) repeat protein